MAQSKILKNKNPNNFKDSLKVEMHEYVKLVYDVTEEFSQRRIVW